MEKSNGLSVEKATVHISLQGKGGVGKSLVASILAQYLQSKGPVACFDTDPVNQTLAGFQALQVERIDVMRRNAINEKQFDRLIEAVCTRDGSFVIDTGATTFVPLWQYMLENEILHLMKSQGRAVYVHSVVTGGQTLPDTLGGFVNVARSTEGRNVIVWLNEYFGEIARDGKPFEEMRAYLENQDKVCGSVTITERNPNTFGDDIRQMLAKRLTFDEAIRSDEFNLVAKQRLAIVKRDLFEQLDRLPLV